MKHKKMKRIVFLLVLICLAASGFAQTLFKLGSSGGLTTVYGDLRFVSHPTFTYDEQIVDKKYVDDLVFGITGSDPTLQDVMDEGNTTTLPLIFTAAGTGRNIGFTNSSTTDNFAVLSVYPSAGTDVGAALAIIPRGTGYISALKSQLSIFNTDFNADQTNYEAFIARAAGTEFSFNIIEGGSGVLRPFSLQMNGTEYFEMGISGEISLANLAGNGAGYVTVDNTGLLGWTSGAGTSNWTVDGQDIKRNSKVGVGSTITPLEALHVEIDHNGATYVLAKNATDAGNSVAGFKADNATRAGFFGINGESRTAYGELSAGRTFIYTNSEDGIVFMADAAASPIVFAAGGNAAVFTMHYDGTSISYLNMGSVAGASGYGFRNNAGAPEWKPSGGSWSGFSGGGGSESTTASNGLTLTGFNVTLGGALTSTVTITGASGAHGMYMGDASSKLLNFTVYSDNDILLLADEKIYLLGGVRHKYTLATDANFTVTQAMYMIVLPTITANRTITIPDLNQGQQIIIINKNSSAFTWNISGTNVKDAADNTLTSLVNDQTYIFLDESPNWYKIN